MRISCDVHVSNCLLPSLNIKGPGRTTHASLAFGRKPGSVADASSLFILLCTAQNRTGTKYKVKDNIQQVFTKFLDEGKATIRFKEPPHDIHIKTDSIQLKGFLLVLKKGLQNKDIDKITLSGLAPASAAQVTKPKTKVVIKSKKDYPITVGFPSTLEVLKVSDIQLKCFDTRILKLRHLHVLDLSHNVLQVLPAAIGTLQQLAELHLSHNQLQQLPPEFCTGTLQKSLKLLDLSSNQFEVIPSYLCQMKGLVNLKIDNNGITKLPFGIGKLTSLTYFSASHNKIETLPGSFTQLRLDALDLCENPLRCGPGEVLYTRLGVFSLAECAAKAIIKYKIHPTDRDLPHNLIAYLQAAQYCLCGRVCLETHVKVVTLLDLHLLAITVTLPESSGSQVAVEAVLCSQRCVHKYQNNPYAF